jgi:hypothetical protein
MRSRMIRARLFLGTAWFVHGTTLVITTLAVVRGTSPSACGRA